MKPIFIIISWTLNGLPRRVVMAVGSVLGLFWFYVLRFRVSVVQENIQKAYRSELTESEVRKLTRRNFQHYGKVFLEVLRSLSWSREKFRKEIEVSGLENVTQFTSKGQGVFLLTLHVGNWELALCTTSAYGVPMDVVVKQTRNRWSEAFLNWTRKRTGARIFFESGTAKDILKSLSAGRGVAFILDQFMGPPIGLPVKFFGREAGTAVAVALLTEKRDCPVIPAFSHRDSDGRLRVDFRAPIQIPNLSENTEERLYQKTQAYNDALEEIVREYPEQWMWLHRRWKDYRGTPRWVLKTSTALTFFLLFLAQCSSTSTPTGIPLPADPKVDAPQFKTEETPPEKPVAAIEPAPPEEPKVVPKPTRKPPKHKKVAPPPPPPAPPPAPVADQTPNFTIIPKDKIPFEIGERQEIELNWMALPAGRAVLEVKDFESVEGRPTYHLFGNVMSSKLVDTIYHVDNTIESFDDVQGFIPYKFLVHMLESAQKKETRVIFDHTKKEAFYWSKRISTKWGNEDQDRTDAFTPGARDMFSALYYARTLDYSMNQRQTVWVYENNQNLQVTLDPVSNELVRSPAGVFQCWKIKVTVLLNNVLKPTGDLFLWLSDDIKKYIVKFDAKVKIGSLYGNLVSVRERK